jgi:hypothetical protein
MRLPVLISITALARDRNRVPGTPCRATADTCSSVRRRIPCPACSRRRPLGALARRLLAREADLRFSLVRVRENAESIAFYRGGWGGSAGEGRGTGSVGR